MYVGECMATCVESNRLSGPRFNVEGGFAAEPLLRSATAEDLSALGVCCRVLDDPTIATVVQVSRAYCQFPIGHDPLFIRGRLRLEAASIPRIGNGGHCAEEELAVVQPVQRGG